MATLRATTLSSWHLPSKMKWILDGGRFVNESGLTPAWRKRDKNNSGEFWSGTKTFLLGTRVN